jgi:hypothetical protein
MPGRTDQNPLTFLLKVRAFSVLLLFIVKQAAIAELDDSYKLNVLLGRFYILC